MGRKQEYSQIGEEIRDALENAINTRDFSGINQVISSTVTGAMEECRRQLRNGFSGVVGNGQEDRQDGNPQQGGQQSAEHSTGQSEDSYNGQQSYGRVFADSVKKVPREVRRNTGIKTRQVGQVSWILNTVFGGIGIGVGMVAALITGIKAALGHSGFLGFVFSMLVVTVSGVMIGRGSMQRERLSRFKRYLKMCGDKTYCDIRLLAAQVNKKYNYVVRDLRKMIRLNMLPEGHLDEESTCLMLDDATYRQYLETRQNCQELSEETEAEDEMKQEQDLAQSYITRLRSLNDAIPGEVISEKLDRLETVLGEIFDASREHPEKKPQLRKFMDYYLPTTLKLVESYAEFDSVQIQGENITSAKQEIEETLDTINKAFEKLLDDLYQDAAFDASTDAQVLQTLLAQEGLTDNDRMGGE